MSGIVSGPEVSPQLKQTGSVHQVLQTTWSYCSEKIREPRYRFSGYHPATAGAMQIRDRRRWAIDARNIRKTKALLEMCS